jgi:Putative addiction module component
MTLEQLEAELLALPKESQAALLARLLGHLGQTNEIDLEVANTWVEEADFRNREMDNGQVIGIPADEVFRRIRASLQ